jgi:hypothetical protein
MSTDETIPLRRYRGVLVWIDADGKRVRQGLIDHAIMRGRDLKMAFTSHGHPYSVTLRPSENETLEGMWTRGLEGQSVSGAAQCRVTPCGAFLVQPGRSNLKLEGVWQEDGQWDWVAKLRPLALPPTG